MYRSHNCGELNASHINTEVTLAGWVQKSRDKGFMNWVDLRDRYGITQLIFDESRSIKEVFEAAKTLGREYVIQVKGTVIEREAKNKNIPTGEIEILVTELNILNASLTPPFTIEDETDGGEDIRMKYRYLDIRRNPVKNSLLFRHKVAMEVRKYLIGFRFLRSGNSLLNQINSRRSKRFCCSIPYERRTILCFTTISTNFQTIIDGGWNG